MLNPLLDKEFLIELDEYHEKEIWAKIIALDWDENPVEEITGRVTGGGSINVDGSSAVRRSCSVSMVAKNVNINDFYWGLHSKFKLFIGLTNKINSKYPDIIWFPQGVYLITNFSTSHSTNNYNISIQGKDKMCTLNGEIGGTLTAPIDFGKIEERDAEGNLTISDIPIKEIIMEGVHEYAKEPWHNIIINNLDDLGIELLEYKGSKPLYMLVNESTGEVTNMTMNEDFVLYDKNGNEVTIANIEAQNSFNKLNEFYPGMTSSYFKGTLKRFVEINSPKYSVAKIEYGQTAGYRLTDIIYAGDLIANQGDSFTSVLDKLVQMLGNFEYFYDLDGRFIFQMKKTYVQQTWNNLITTTEDEVIADTQSTPFSYEFKSGILTTSFSNNPNLTSLKNDFSIWGSRKSVTGAEIPVHLRYAIDKKPFYYKTIDGRIYCTNPGLVQPEKTPLPEGLNDDWWEIRDWGEYYKLITGEYPNEVMNAYKTGYTKVDLNKYFPPGTTWNKSNDLFLFEVNADGTLRSTVHNPSCTSHRYTDYFVKNANAYNAKTYFYKPLIPIGTNRSDSCDWREIIYQMAKDYRKHNHDDDFLVKVKENNFINGEYLYPDGYTGYEQYYIDLEGFWRQLYNPDYETDNPNLGGDGPIETEIEVSPVGTFVDTNLKNVYLYPIIKINKTKKDDDGNPLYTADNTLVVTKGDKYNIKPFINKETCLLDENREYFRKYNNADDPVEITLELAKSSSLASLYIKEGTEYSRWVDYVFNKYSSSTIVNNQEYICAQSKESKKLTEVIKDNFIKGIYVYKNENNEDCYWPYYFTKVYRDEEKKSYYYDYKKIKYYYTTYNYYSTDEAYPYWNKNVWESPELLNFWFDFMDTDGEMNKYAVSVIGNRPKVINDSSIKGIYFRETPTVIFINKSNTPGWTHTERKSGYTYIQIPESMLSLFNISSQGKSAQNMLEECMYNDTYCIESVSMNTIPIYYLQPNTRIYIRNDDSKIDGEYIVSRFTIPLNYNGTMSISATKLADRIY